MVTESTCAMAGLVIGSCIGGICVIGHCIECCGLRSQMTSNFHRVFPSVDDIPASQRHQQKESVIFLAPEQLIIIQNPDESDMRIGLKISNNSDTYHQSCRKNILGL